MYFIYHLRLITITYQLTTGCWNCFGLGNPEFIFLFEYNSESSLSFNKDANCSSRLEAILLKNQTKRRINYKKRKEKIER